APAIPSPGTGTTPATSPAAIQYLLGLLPAPADTAAPAGEAAPGVQEPAPMSADDRREPAGRHGLIAEPDVSGVVFIRRDTGPGARYALRQEQPGPPLMNRPGRIIPAGSADAYLAAWIAKPDADPDDLYTRAIPDTGTPPAAEHAYPRERCHIVCSEATSRARETGTAHYLYADGRAAVAAARPPATAAYYEVSPAGQWTRHMAGTAEPLGPPPNAQALSVIAGETAAGNPESASPESASLAA